jgi:hypothetical protein
METKQVNTLNLLIFRFQTNNNNMMMINTSNRKDSPYLLGPKEYRIFLLSVQVSFIN